VNPASGTTFPARALARRCPQDTHCAAVSMPLGGKTFQEIRENWSEWQDLNLRPPAPEAGALPGCATLRPPRLTYIDVSPESRKKRPDCRGACALAYRCPWLGLLVGGRPLTIIIVRAWPNFRAGPSRANHRQRNGAWPSGKATGFGPVILGSNPSAPATSSRVFQFFPDLRDTLPKKPRNCATSGGHSLGSVARESVSAEERRASCGLSLLGIFAGHTCEEADGRDISGMSVLKQLADETHRRSYVR
jgi:hypothetical protein